ncbi:nucleoside triphosphate pyrophosphohydrolase, partial [Candidatus Peregrinibacteria bacterium]|nr:nucleoside triphosphate pyrophosphohydrolase [Candidatus Peregrinibacteria bacterium]
MKTSFQKLINIGKKLRSPTGCPWDREQSLEHWTKYVGNELAELKIALKNNDRENFQEELGDIFFNLVMMTVIAEEKKWFTTEKLLKGIAKKIIRRHTWVFGKDKAKTA